MILYGRGGSRSHSLYNHQIWYATGKYLFYTIRSEKTRFAAELNVPQGKSQILSDRQRMFYDEILPTYSMFFSPAKRIRSSQEDQ